MILPAGVFTLELFPEKTRNHGFNVLDHWSCHYVRYSLFAPKLLLEISTNCIELFFAFELDLILASMNYKIFKDLDQFVSLYFGK